MSPARSVDDLVAALGIDSGMSKSEVSRICAGLDEVVTAFRDRWRDHIESYFYPGSKYPNAGARAALAG